MRLYYMPGACSLAPHIVAREAGLAIDIDKVDYNTRKTQDGTSFEQINPKGYVPALRLDTGEVLTEAATLVQYLADKAPASKLAPANGTIERYRLQEWLTFISTELHKAFGPLWNPATPDATKEAAKAALAKRFTYVDQHFAKNKFLMGEQFTVADAYLFTVVNWVNFHNIDLSPYANLKSYQQRVSERPAVKQAISAENA
jgi:glutathione S-transferase